MFPRATQIKSAQPVRPLENRLRPPGVSGRGIARRLTRGGNRTVPAIGSVVKALSWVGDDAPLR